ncbi:MAG: hypothetical protein JNL82_40610 [Myxococcales bacterium]|nr:hypothetical protein [Myxococcales bacterium]
MSAAAGEELIRELLTRGCVTVRTADDRGDAARTRLFPRGDVVNIVRRDVVGTPLLDRHLADVQATLAALTALTGRTEAALARLARWRRYAPAGAAALAASTGAGLTDLAPLLWPVLAALVWGLGRGAVVQVGRRAARHYAARLLR